MVKTRILQIVPGNMNMGGIERFIMGLYKNIDRTKYQFDFIVHSQEKNYFEDEILALGGRVYHLPPKAKDILNYKKQLCEIMKTYQIVHIHASYAFMYFEAKWAKKLGKLVIFHSHSSKQEGKKLILHKILKPYLCKFIDVKCAVSSAAAKFMYKDLSNIQYIFGFNINKFIYSSTNRLQIRKQLNITDNDYLVGCIARLDAQKDPVYTNDIFKKLINRKNIKCIFIGDGKYKEELMIKDKFENKIIFTGNVKDPEKYLSALDAYVLPTKYEGIGTSIIEAEINGLRVYSSKEGTPIELFKLSDKLNILSKSDINSWINLILHDLDESKNYQRVENIKKYNKFDIKECANRMENIYDKI